MRDYAGNYEAKKLCIFMQISYYGVSAEKFSPKNVIGSYSLVSARISYYY